MRISYSQIYEVFSCEWRFHTRYVMGYRPAERVLTRERGSVMHVGIAETLRGREPWEAIDTWAGKELQRLTSMSGMEEMVEQGIEIIDEAKVTARLLLPRFQEWFENESGMEVVGDWIEKSFEVDMGDGVSFYGVIDTVVEHRTLGVLAVVDFKVREVFQPQEQEETNLQKALYQWALMQQDLVTDASAIVQIYPGVPKTPATIKSGALSRSRIRTDWPTYRGAAIAAGLDPDDYSDMEAKIEDWDSQWYGVNWAFRGAHELNGVERDILRPAIDMITKLWDADTAVRTGYGSRICSFCSYRTLCTETLRGYQLDDAAAFGYTNREQRQEQQNEATKTQ